MRSIVLVVGVMVFVQLSSSDAAEAPGRAPPEIGANETSSSDAGASIAVGRCGTYDAVDGLARIERVEETATSAARATSGGGPGYAGYEVWFSFMPDAPVSDAGVAAWIAKEHELRLTNSWYPGPAFVKKYELETGKTIPAVLEVQKAGPCTPFVFRFPSVDTADYFESAQ